MSALSISNLKLDIHGHTVLHDIDLTLEPGKILGVVGESGSGKSMTALSVMQLLPRGPAAGAARSGSAASVFRAWTRRRSARCAAATSA